MTIIIPFATRNYNTNTAFGSPYTPAHVFRTFAFSSIMAELDELFECFNDNPAETEVLKPIVVEESETDG